MDAAELDGRVALVTGSTSGIGAAVVRTLAGLGASVVVNSSRSVAAGEALADELGDHATYVQGDISVAADRERLVASTIERFGRLDHLVNNAGWTTSVPHDDLDALTPEIFQRTLDVNVTGTWELTRLALPHLRGSDDAAVVTITSMAGIRPMGSSIAYAMSKAALNHMTRLLARSHGPVRFTAVAPGLVATPWTEGWDELHETVEQQAPLGRVATPEDCAEAVLAAIRNRYMTGAVLVVDGGLCQVL
jgi:ketoreductase RED2